MIGGAGIRPAFCAGDGECLAIDPCDPFGDGPAQITIGNAETAKAGIGDQ